MNYQQINNHPERTSKIEPFINNYNWKETSFPPHKEDWNNFEKNNESIALNVLFVPHNTKKCLSKRNSEKIK